ncbi:LysR substrate-binding domain-containing protein [Halopseudomonas phragmitis]|uniref:LysR family transcriptional regulator n=1 Tax=Halopseudomonas phragmitis TaxID=1931241 RepID=A0A1V0B231_9GAMM|nr:LysR substrate-binding domain-containing protein [Halopseudomonas phragmitis]AQZ93965.1 LysR family transcriptional regulator [Halopseudomonas phragmitis]
MQDLNDLYFYVQVVEYSGFSAAGRALGMPKSRLSRRIAQLEERLNARLINRSSRRFSVTELGQEYYRHCKAMLTEAEAAQELIDRAHAEPRGLVRLSCPTALLQFRVAPMLSEFMRLYPQIELQIEASNRRVDVVHEGLDIALRVRFPPLEDSDLTMKVLAQSPQQLVAAPGLLAETGILESPEHLQRLPSLDWERPYKEHLWCLEHVSGHDCQITHRPRLVSDDMGLLRQAALDGVGIVQLPLLVAGHDLQAGRLQAVLPDWRPRGGIIHAVFPSRRGLLPSVRTLLDFLGERFGDSDFIPACTQ